MPMDTCNKCGTSAYTLRLTIGIYWRDLCRTCAQDIADTVTAVTTTTA